LWYIAQYITISNYDNNSLTVKIYSKKQRQWFFDKVCKYNGIEEHNFFLDIEDELYKTHHRGYKDNEKILEKIVKENRK